MHSILGHAAILAGLLGIPSFTAAQTACGATLLARGDTTGAIADCEILAVGPPESAEARHRAGQLLLARYLAGAQSDADRDRAERHFTRATELAPDSARYLLGLADVARTKTLIFERSRVGELVDRALALAREHGSGHLAEIEFRAAVVDWERYEQLAHRYAFFGDAQSVDPYLMVNEWRDVETFFGSQVRPVAGDPGGNDRRASEEHLRAALSADPRHVNAAGLLAVLLLEDGRRVEAVELGRTLVRAAPDSGRAWAVLGMTLAREDRWAEAQGAFDSALARLEAAAAAPYRNLGFILKSMDQARYGAMTSRQQEILAQLYWAVSQPLFLADVNEARVEFFARLTYVIHRWSDPLRRAPGYDSDRGAVYLRWGPPDVWASFGRSAQSQWDALSSLEGERNTIIWVYNASQLRFVFSMTPGFGRTTFSGDFRTFYNETRDLFPVRFDNVPAIADMDTILVQFAQFRGERTESTELGVYAFMPIGRMARDVEAGDLRLETAATVHDGRMAEVQGHRRDEVIRGGDSLQVERRSFRFEVEPDAYLLRVEARLPAAERAARSTSALSVRAYGTDSLTLSDVLVADRVAPRDSIFTRWTDFLLSPSAGRFAPNDPVGLLWEIYNLTPDSLGIARYTVEVRFTVLSVERRGFAARVLGGLGDAMGLSARGDDRVALTYDREVRVAAGGRQVEYLLVDLDDAPLADYGIAVRVLDRTTGRAVEAIRRITVTNTPLARN
ncbi:MAG TPA: GWxTD domain-containing protein [Gemmatimonadales bacterium]|jgi:GWxTD domain-containing protein